MMLRFPVRRVLLPLFLALFSLGFPLSLAAQRGVRMVHRNLAEMVDEAETIVHGQVVSVDAESHPQFANLRTVVVTLQVNEILKGRSGSFLTFRQFVLDPRDLDTRLGYKPGQALLLLLIRPSPYGLSSPTGLDQGRFLLHADGAGEFRALNGNNNAGLFRDIAKKVPRLQERLSDPAQVVVSQHSAGPVSYRYLREIIRALVEVRGD